MPQEPSSAERLLLRNLQQFYKTGEVLETEFKLIHGEGKWDPADRMASDDRARLIRQATHHFKSQLLDMPVATEAQRQARAGAEREAENEAKRLALHAWSVRISRTKRPFAFREAASAVPLLLSVFCKASPVRICCTSSIISPPFPAEAISAAG
jgi:hypothetical protein